MVRFVHPRPASDLVEPMDQDREDAMSGSRRNPPPIDAHTLRGGEHGDASPRPGDDRQDRGDDLEERDLEQPPARKDPMIVGKPSQAEGDRETIEEDLRIQEEREKQRQQRKH